MQKVDLDAMSIEDLAALRDRAVAKLAEKVAQRQKELEAELDRLSVYGVKPRKASAAKAAKETPKEAAKDSAKDVAKDVAKAA
jgi:hypothetical protein